MKLIPKAISNRIVGDTAICGNNIVGDTIYLQAQPI